MSFAELALLVVLGVVVLAVVGVVVVFLVGVARVAGSRFAEGWRDGGRRTP